jgi:transcriptional regulator with XRE-family HTH domain
LPLVHIRLKCPKPKDYSDNPQTIGEHLRKRRIELGLSQTQAAECLAVSAATVLNWEKGKQPPLVSHLGAVITFLGYYPFPESVSISERLHRKRRENGWSTSDAARQLGVDRTTWQDWERGELILFRKHRTKVARLLGLDPEALASEMRARWNGKHRRWECREP